MSPPPNLQGLNLVHPAQHSDSYVANSHDLLNFPGLSAQLDIWSNLAFESDEPLVRKRLGGEVDESSPSVEDEDEDDANDGQPARADNHDNVVMGNPIPAPPVQPPTVASRPPLNAFDIGSLLAGFGIDPFLASSVQSTTSATPSLAQILSLYPNAALPPIPPATTTEAGATPHTPAAKRSRTRVSSVSASTGGEQSSDGASPAATSAMSPMTPMTPAEDKRRRNTAASARFRLKKKEREAALEKKSKELEMRVMELERECEGLRRENGWLKGLVVGVTGVGATQHQAPVTAGVKRPREDIDSGSN
jgi:hypothetical protein